ncbi:hypothetical protein JCM6882_009082 [Rhodosporidiobolus microsporus]
MGSSIDINPSTANIALTAQGSEFLWTWFALFTSSALVLLFVAHQRPVGHRAFHYFGVAALVVTALAYLYMASNLGWTPIPVEWVRSGSRGADQVANGAPNPPTRSISYARWIQFFLTWPILILMLHLATGFALSRVFFDLFVCDVCLLVGALIESRYKWASYTFACVFLLYEWWSLLHPMRLSAFRLGDDYGRAYIRSASFLVLIWFVYPIIWAVSEGGNVITVTSECIAYGILDLLTTVVFTFFFLYACEGLDYERFEFASGKYSDSAAHHPAGAGAGAAAGAAAGHNNAHSNANAHHDPGLRHGLRGHHDRDNTAGGQPQTAMAPGSTPATASARPTPEHPAPAAGSGAGGGARAVPGASVEEEFRTGAA